jgi:hypothetical protein
MQVKGAQLWGTDIYTNDSDLVAGKFLLTVQTSKSLGSFQSSNVFFLVLMHTGYCSPTSSPPPSAIQELRATVRVLPPQESKSFISIPFCQTWFRQMGEQGLIKLGIYPRLYFNIEEQRTFTCLGCWDWL